MRTWICRCEHCGKEYSYQASGAGCHNPLNNEHYCPECQQVIIDALSKIPVQFEKRYKSIERPDESIINEMRARVEKELKYDEDYERQYGFRCPRALKVMYFDSWVKTSAEFTIDWTSYRVESPSDDLFDENSKWFRQEEFDRINKQFTDKIWHTDKENAYVQLSVSHWPNIKAEDIKPTEISEPSGKLWFMDIIKTSD